MTPLPPPLPRSFYNRAPQMVAPELLGMWLISRVAGKLCVGRIVETEAYLSENDTACHAHRGLSKKNEAMFGPPGHAYVYMIHAKWCFNAVTESTGVGSAVLIRALEPIRGQSHMHQRRQRTEPREWTRGPARLSQAMGIDRRHNHWDLTAGKTLWIAAPPTSSHSPDRIVATRRIGISTAQDLPLRFIIAENRFVSGPASKRQRE
jgi:DNA-3-methyladenine glycosylase